MHLNPAYLIAGLISAAWATPLPAKHESSASFLQSRAGNEIVVTFYHRSASGGGDPRGVQDLVYNFLAGAARHFGITDPEIYVPDNYDGGSRVEFSVTGFKQCKPECMGEVTFDGGGSLKKNTKSKTRPFYEYSPSGHSDSASAR
ncbi:hypothetical protein DFJ43DRAFT_1102786 [Lentinula guzmanii]|uniref:Uncharacterized protein n=1 Tax=Lentinula guzmanii TaxID=2804957 RepID=A0AA38JAS4_9AGAR|nr:hypothetical protein DFJ43DRAFT_1102786 [Lentinula guzmanii]